MIEQYQPEQTRLFNDAVAKELVGAPIRALMQISAMRNFTIKQTDAVGKGIFGAQICRTRYIDEAVLATLSQAQGVGQLVILGAGYDTRPYRLPGLDGVKVFEVDLPAVQDDKKKKIQKYLGRMPEQVSFIPIDFDTQTLEAVFTGTGFDRSRPAVFIWEGVTQYITEAAVKQTLAFVGKSAPGSMIVFTYVLKSVIERRSDIPGAEHMMDIVSQQSPWIFGLEPSGVTDFLKPFHLSLVADVGNADYQEKYLKPIERNLVVSEVERIVQAMLT
jgi:methyltransferase (TIGR00027 family)